MTFNNLHNLTDFLINHGYLIFFIFSCLEGSVVGIVGGILSRLGHFNIFIIFLISILGDFIPDIIYFLIGRRGFTFIEKIKIFRNKENQFKQVLKLKELANKHLVKSLVFLKFSPIPFVAPTGLILLGSFKIDYKKYLKYNFIITFIKSFFFVFLGYISGGTYLYLSAQLKSFIKPAIIVFIFIVIIFSIYKIIVRKEVKKIENNI